MSRTTETPRGAGRVSERDIDRKRTRTMHRYWWTAASALVLGVVAVLLLRHDSGEPIPAVEVRDDKTALRTEGQKRAAPARQRAGAQDPIDESATTSRPIQQAAPAEQPRWVVRLERQRAVFKKLAGHTIVANWTGDTPLDARFQAIARELDVTVSCDPALPANLRSTSPDLDFGSAPAWTVLTYLARHKGVSIRVTEDGVRLVPRLLPREPSRVETYDDDPFGAFAAAGNFTAADANFHTQWQSIDDCEQAPVELPPDARIEDVNSLRSALSTPLTLRYPPNFVHTLGSAGLRSGAAIAVVQSWLPDAVVVVGRGGLEAWPRQDESQAKRVAADKSAYERFRGLLAKTTWDPSPGDYTWADVAAALASEKTLSVTVLLDPDVARTPVHVTAPTSFLAVLDEPRLRAGPEREIPGGAAAWTCVSGILVLTFERHEE